MARASTPGPDAAVGLLVELGLTFSEARCYVALLDSGSASAGELAESSGVPRPKVYGVLKSLEQRRFCYPSGDRVTVYRPVDPDLALTEWTHTREHERRLEAERDRQLREELVDILPSLPDHRSGGSDEPVMELSDGAGTAMSIIEGLMQRAEKRLDITHGEPVVQDPKRWNQVELEMRAKGVQVRVLFPTKTLAKKRRAHELVKGGCEVRVARELPLKLMVRDNGAEAGVALREDAQTDSTRYLMIRHADLAGPIQLLFNRAWRGAKPFS